MRQHPEIGRTTARTIAMAAIAASLVVALSGCGRDLNPCDHKNSSASCPAVPATSTPG